MTDRPRPIQRPAPDPPLGAGDAMDLPRLLRAAAAGDEEAWRKIVHLYARRVYGLARSRLCSHGLGPASGLDQHRHRPARERAGSGGFVHGHDLAEEVTQSVFVTVAGKLAEGEYTEQGRFESWLFRVAMNRIRDEVRRTRRHAQPTDPETLDASTAAPAHAAPADSPASDELLSLRAALGQLSEQDREIIELRHHAGMSFKQMADLLTEPIGTLLARHHRALRKLKDLLTTGPARTAHSGGEAP